MRGTGNAAIHQVHILCPLGVEIPPPGAAETNTLWRGPRALLLCLNSPSDRVIGYQHDDRSNHSNHHAVKIETGEPARTEKAEKKAPTNAPTMPRMTSIKKPWVTALSHFSGAEAYLMLTRCEASRISSVLR